MFTIVYARSVLHLLANRSLPQELPGSKEAHSQQREIAPCQVQDRPPRFAHVVCTFAHVRTHYKLGSCSCLGHSARGWGTWHRCSHRHGLSKSSPVQIGIAGVFTWTLLLRLGQIASTRAPGCLTQSRTSEALSGQGFTSWRLCGSKQPRSKQPAGAWTPRSRWWPGHRVMAAPEDSGKQWWRWRPAGGMLRF